MIEAHRLGDGGLALRGDVDQTLGHLLQQAATGLLDGLAVELREVLVDLLHGGVCAAGDFAVARVHDGLRQALARRVDEVVAIERLPLVRSGAVKIAHAELVDLRDGFLLQLGAERVRLVRLQRAVKLDDERGLGVGLGDPRRHRLDANALQRAERLLGRELLAAIDVEADVDDGASRRCAARQLRCLFGNRTDNRFDDAATGVALLGHVLLRVRIIYACRA